MWGDSNSFLYKRTYVHVTCQWIQNAVVESAFRWSSVATAIEIERAEESAILISSGNAFNLSLVVCPFQISAVEPTMFIVYSAVPSFPAGKRLNVTSN
jgi:hypothetical protein